MSLAEAKKVKSVKGKWAIMEDEREVDLTLVGEVKKGDMLMVSQTLAVSKLSTKAKRLMNKLNTKP